MVGELQSATDAHLHYFMLWRMFGGLPEIFNFARGKPHQDYEAYRLRPGFVCVCVCVLVCVIGYN